MSNFIFQVQQVRSPTLGTDVGAGTLLIMEKESPTSVDIPTIHHVIDV
jgi:hypothetical protein